LIPDATVLDAIVDEMWSRLNESLIRGDIAGANKYLNNATQVSSGIQSHYCRSRILFPSLPDIGIQGHRRVRCFLPVEKDSATGSSHRGNGGVFPQ
jgi:hypothetical protein